MQMVDLKDQKIALLALGVENVELAKYLLTKGIGFTVHDKKDHLNMEDFFPRSLLSMVSTQLGEKYLDGFGKYDIIFRTPGFHRLSPVLLEVEKTGGVISSQTKLFFDLCPAQIVGVTGTKGKGTTSTLIAEILRNTGRRVFLGGNIGTPPISFLHDLHSEDVVVLELSSFQLQDLHRSPCVSVVLMVTSEHLDHHIKTDEYVEAKKSIVRYQLREDYAIINDDYEASQSFVQETPAKIFRVSRQHEVQQGAFVRDDTIIMRDQDVDTVLCHIDDILLPGAHNLENVMAAALAGKAFGVSHQVIRDTLRVFRGLPYRLELVRELNGIKYYNDSFSTIPESAIVALQAFSQPKIIILGGSDKGSDYRQLGQSVIQEKTKAVVLIGAMAEKIREVIESAARDSEDKPILLDGALTMREIVQRVSGIARSGDVVILSPACASFGMFKDYKDRGDQFRKSVLEL